MSNKIRSQPRLGGANPGCRANPSRVSLALNLGYSLRRYVGMPLVSAHEGPPFDNPERGQCGGAALH
jgi:hypothetical protein